MARRKKEKERLKKTCVEVFCRMQTLGSQLVHDTFLMFSGIALSNFVNTLRHSSYTTLGSVLEKC
jgi:hypothetical protein